MSVLAASSDNKQSPSVSSLEKADGASKSQPPPAPAVSSNEWVNGKITRVIIVGAGSSSSTPKLECIIRGPKNDCKACKEAYGNLHSPNNRLNPCLLIQVEADEPQALLPSSASTAVVAAATAEGSSSGGGGAEAPSSFAPQITEGNGSANTTTKVSGNILIDVTKTFRESAMKVLAPLGVSSLNSVILTHDHADACLGLDDLREFSSNFDSKKGKAPVPLNAWTDKQTNESMKRVFPYLFPIYGRPKSYVSQVDWNVFTRGTSFPTCGIQILPFAVEHGPNYVSNGYSMKLPGENGGTLLYISDVSKIYPESYDLIKTLAPIKVLILDLLSNKEIPSHFSFDQSVEAAKLIGAEKTWFVGMGHTLEYAKSAGKLAPHFPNKEAEFGQDGLVVFDVDDKTKAGTTIWPKPDDAKAAEKVAVGKKKEKKSRLQ